MEKVMSERERHLGRDLGREFAAAVSTLLDKPHTTAPGDMPDPMDWVVRFRIGGAGSGAVFFGFRGGEANALARLIMGLDAEPAPAAVQDTLKELSAQAAGALSQKPVASGLTIGVDAVGSALESQPTEAAGLAITFGDELVLHLGVWSALVLPDDTHKAEAPREAPSGAGGEPGQTAPSRELPDNLEVILDIELPTSIRFGQTEIALQTLTRLGPGSVIDLGRSPDDPVEVLVSGRMVARGEVVVLAGNYGVRITEVISRPDRLGQLEP